MSFSVIPDLMMYVRYLQMAAQVQACAQAKLRAAGLPGDDPSDNAVSKVSSSSLFVVWHIDPIYPTIRKMKMIVMMVERSLSFMSLFLFALLLCLSLCMYVYMYVCTYIHRRI